MKPLIIFKSLSEINTIIQNHLYLLVIHHIIQEECGEFASRVFEFHNIIIQEVWEFFTKKIFHIVWEMASVQ